MAVTVITSLNGYRQPSTVDTYPNGQYITVKEGHLKVETVKDGEFVTVGLYSPDSWHSASIDDEAKFNQL